MGDDNQTFLTVTLQNGWTWEEYLAIVKALAESIRQHGHTVDAIVEITSKIPFPSGSALSRLRQILPLLPNNIGVIDLVSPNPFVKTINQILFQLSTRARDIAELADSREEANALIVRRRAQRPNAEER
jgi:hypothetical protein